jgi:hypothetical protein
MEFVMEHALRARAYYLGLVRESQADEEVRIQKSVDHYEGLGWYEKWMIVDPRKETGWTSFSERREKAKNVYGKQIRLCNKFLELGRTQKGYVHLTFDDQQVICAYLAGELNEALEIAKAKLELEQRP